MVDTAYFINCTGKVFPSQGSSLARLKGLNQGDLFPRQRRGECQPGATPRELHPNVIIRPERAEGASLRPFRAQDILTIRIPGRCPGLPCAGAFSAFQKTKSFAKRMQGDLTPYTRKLPLRRLSDSYFDSRGFRVACAIVNREGVLRALAG
jgi:hypothetical protein